MPSHDLHDRVLAELGWSIVAGERSPGEVLRMDELEAEFSVSRSVMREVIRVLGSMNLVESRRSVGITVRDSLHWNPFDPEIIRWRLAGPDRVEQLRSLGELRAGIEPIAAQLAAARALPEHCGELTRAVIGMSVAAKAGDIAEFLRHDVVFHRTLLVASGNVMFVGLSETVSEVLVGRAEHHLMPEPPERDAVDLHVEVATAIQSGDGAAARAAMEAILEDTSRGLESVALAHPRESPSALTGS
jgi:DNA-binding FadR family transcriptional regulator